ncbi:MAG: T9SS type A sorting domain-containing protein, partial [Flavobacteriales bacterium]|nr:T9SS type A sorting domain-containing protein [Flavobacteriales bacterium]
YLDGAPDVADFNWTLENGDTYYSEVPVLTLDGLQGDSYIWVDYFDTNCNDSIFTCWSYWAQGCACESFFEYETLNNEYVVLYDNSYSDDPSAYSYFTIDGVPTEDGEVITVPLNLCESHEVCLYLVGENCESVYCQPIGGECTECGDEEIFNIGDTCNPIFELSNVSEDTEVFWTVGDWSTWGGPVLEWWINVEGEYIVSAAYADGDCDETIIEDTFYAENCSCEGAYEYEEIDGDGHVFYAYSENDEAIFMWFLNGVNVGEGPVITLDLDPCMDNEVCLCTISQACESWHCNTFDGEDCGECTNVDFAIDSFVTEGGPDGVAFSLYGPVDFYSWFEFNEEIMYQDFSLCLPDGCYEVVIDASWIENPEAFFTGAFIDGVELDYVNEPSYNGTLVTYSFGINSECQDPCNLEVDLTLVEGEYHLFTANSNGEYTQVDWFIDEEYVNFGAELGVDLDPGIHVVCAVMETPDCPWGTEACITVEVEDDDCEDILIWFEALGPVTEAMTVEYTLESDGYLHMGTIQLSDTCGEAGANLCLPAGCYNIEIYTDGPFEIWTGCYMDGELLVQDFVPGMTLTEMTDMGVASECTNSIVEETASFDWNTFPNPSDGQFSVLLSRWAPATIKVYSMNGQLVLEQELEQLQTEFQTDLPAGLYSVNLEFEENGEWTRLNKQISIVK